MALLENTKIFFSILSLILINECLSFPMGPQFVMLNERLNQASTDFMPMLFHDPRFPQKRPQVLFVPVERKPRPQMQTHDIDEDESQIIPSDNPYLNPEPVDDHHDHHHHHHYHHDHDHYDTDQEQEQE